MPPLNYPAPTASPGANPWTPKFPGFAVSPQTGSQPGPSTGSNVPWEPSPPTSHVYGFKMQAGGFVSKFYAPSIGAPVGTTAILHVAFKPGAKTGQPHPNTISSEYAYFFPTAAAAQGWFDMMKQAAHPGEVVQKLISASIPYKRVHG